MLDDRIERSRREELAALDVDWGSAYAGPDGEGGLLAYPADLAAAIGARGIEPEALAMTTSPQEPMRRGPSHQAELISEVLGGEWVSVLRKEGDWWLVIGEDGYVGWTNAWTLREQDGPARRALRARFMGRYAHPRGTLWSSDNWAEGTLWMGMPLLCPEEGPRTRGTRVLVTLTSGGTGWLDEDALLTPPSRADLGEMLRMATRLLGTPYRWGGRSPGGLDCSGFVQLAFLLGGFDLPRDSGQQVRCGEAVDLDEAGWRAGDLLFFGDPCDHVGIHDGRGGLVHCSGLARRQPLGDIPQLMARLSQVRRIGSDSVVNTRTLWRYPAVAPAAS
jgi:cell wall-associated NlpC family hydrolase